MESIKLQIPRGELLGLKSVSWEDILGLKSVSWEYILGLKSVSWEDVWKISVMFKA